MGTETKAGAMGPLASLQHPQHPEHGSTLGDMWVTIADPPLVVWPPFTASLQAGARDPSASSVSMLSPEPHTKKEVGMNSNGVGLL